MSPKKRRRAVVALAMLISVTYGRFESISGDLGDLTTHYGEVVEAGHGSDLAGAVAAESHGLPDDDHIKGFDHCSHAHGCAVVVSSVPFAMERAVAQPGLSVPLTSPPDAPSSRLYHPPRA